MLLIDEVVFAIKKELCTVDGMQYNLTDIDDELSNLNDVPPIFYVCIPILLWNRRTRYTSTSAVPKVLRTNLF